MTGDAPATRPAPDLPPQPTPLPSLFAIPELRAFLGMRLAGGLVRTGLATVVGYQVYELTHNPFALAAMGLVQAVPSISLALFGGHLADRRDRRAITLYTTFVVMLSVLVLAALAFAGGEFALAGILLVVFMYGLAQGLNRPSLAALEQQVIPFEYAAKGVSAAAAVWQGGSIAGGPISGVAYAVVGPGITYLGMAVLIAIQLACLTRIRKRPVPVAPSGNHEGLRESLAIGIRYVFRNQPLVGSMALDLIAVLFGGVVAILPIFATDILHVGSAGLGLLNTAPSVGALLIMTAATRRPPMVNAGRILLACVFGFGASILVFALSDNFVLSLAALFMTGVTDGLSVVIRTVILRVMSPEHLRGRIAAVNWVFIGTSNEIGAFESGTAAGLLGTVPSVLMGGVVTILIAAAVALTMPVLRNLNLNDWGEERKPSPANA